MGETELLAIPSEIENDCKPFDEATKTVDFARNSIGSFLKHSKLYNFLRTYINAKKSGESSDSFSRTMTSRTSPELPFLCPDSLEDFLESLVKRSRILLNNSNEFNLGCFACDMCCDVMVEPVTLKCGHTFSKKCLLTEGREDIECKKCGRGHSFTYLSQLKNNVMMSTLIEKYLHCQNTVFKLSNGSHLSISDKNSLYWNSKTSNTNAPAQMEGKLEEVALYCLITYTLNPKDVLSRERAFKMLQYIMFKCPSNNSQLPRTFAKCSLSKKKSIASVYDSHSIPKNNFFFLEGQNSQIINNMSTFKKYALEDCDKMHLSESNEAKALCDMLENYCKEISIIADWKTSKEPIKIPSIDKQDLECALCIRILWEPVTTPCGHTFCRACLNRCLDHQSSCPLCKTSLSEFLAERIQSTTEIIELAIKTLLPKDYAERKALHEQEVAEIYNGGKDPEHVIPIFVCTVALPTVPCPLHVFEPRYRCMIRQCMESGTRQFGMCAYIDNDIAEYGTMLEIRDVQYFPDGRSVVDTIGSRRFRILRKGERDGYTTAAVEFLKDESMGLDMQGLQEEVYQVYETCQIWFGSLPESTKQEILMHFGPMPEIEPNYATSPNGPSYIWWILAVLPIKPRVQLIILSMTSLLKRVRTLYRLLLHLQSPIA